MKIFKNRTSRKFIRNFAAMSLVVGLSTSCDNFTENINVDPNSVSEVPTSYLLTSAQSNLAFNIMDIAGYDVFGSIYSQQMANNTYTGLDRYDGDQSSFIGFYSGGLYNLTEVIRLNTDEATKEAAAASGDNNNQIAIAKILRAWTFMTVTDTWGDAPYSEALQGTDNYQPKYDAQLEIYQGIIAELKEAAASITSGLNPVVGDRIYDGDMASWKKFAGSLLLRAGMRFSNVNPSLAQETINAGLAIGVIESNAENASFKYGGDASSASPWYNEFNIAPFRIDYSLSHTMVNFLGDRNDPRLPVFGKPIRNISSRDDDSDDFWLKYKPYVVDGNTYAGQPYGYLEATAQLIAAEETSLIGDYFTEDIELPSIIISYSEVLFLMAEAKERFGIGSGSAEDYYNAAIEASWQQFGISTAGLDTYLAQPTVAYNSTMFAKSIGEQKWVAMFGQGLNSWAEWRRLGYPQLQRAPDAAGDEEIPRRRAYTQSEFDLNETNVNAAISRMGGNELSTKTTWDGGN
ncbi:MAG: SusD/RagB family nutrient-binding outer membrane lipoprotein [Lutimonas sp.]